MRLLWFRTESGAEYILDLDAHTLQRAGSSGYQLRTADGTVTSCSPIVIGKSVTILARESLNFPGGSRVIFTTPVVEVTEPAQC